MQPLRVALAGIVAPGLHVTAYRLGIIRNAVVSRGANEGLQVGDILRVKPIQIIIPEIANTRQRVGVVVVPVHLAAEAHLLAVVEAGDAKRPRAWTRPEFAPPNSPPFQNQT